MTLGLCLMMKNEAEYLPNFFETSQGFIDDYFILDTGSTDNSMQIAREYTKNIFFKEFTEDFSEMRNYLLGKTTTDWLIFLDADELLTAETWKKINQLIADRTKDRIIGGYRFIRYNFFATGGWFSDSMVKLFLNFENFKYDKKATEKIEPSIISKGFQVCDSNLIINHLGHQRPFSRRHAKSLHYINLLKQQLIITPEDTLNYSFMGLIQRNTGNLKDALTHAKIGVEENPEHPISNLFYAHVLRSQGENREAIIHYQHALELTHNKAPIKNMIGLVYLSEGKFEQALVYFEKGYQENSSYIHILINIGLVYYFQENYRVALTYFEKVAQKNPYFLKRSPLGILEYDPYKSYYYETIFQYSGLEQYINDCQQKIIKESE